MGRKSDVTPSYMAFIRKHYKSMTPYEMSVHTGIGEGSIQRFCAKHGLDAKKPKKGRPASRLPDDDIAFIKEHGKDYSIPQLSRLLARPLKFIATYCEANNIETKSHGEVHKNGKQVNKPAKEKEIRIQRPPAVYTNSRSPFGIADDLHNTRSIAI